MTTYTRKQQAIISKGIASNIVKMNLPDFDEVNKLFGEFGITLCDKTAEPIGYTTKEVIDILALLFMYSNANGGQLLKKIKGETIEGKIRTVLFEYNNRNTDLPMINVLKKL